LEVNFHTLKMFCELRGGISIFPAEHSQLDVCCLLMVPNAERYRQTLRTCDELIEQFSADDYLTIANFTQANAGQMSVSEIVALLRLGGYDPDLFGCYARRLLELAPTLTATEVQSMLETFDRVWAVYFPIGEASNLAQVIGVLCYELGDIDRAL